MQENGMVIPLSILWSNDKIFEIDKVLDIKKQASTKGGGFGIRYTCKIKGTQKYIWLDGYTWFVEMPNPNDN